MKDIIEFIDKKRSEVEGVDRSSLYLKLELLKKITLYLSNNDLCSKVDEVISIIDMDSGYSEYRLINDCESDNRNLWIEYKGIRLNAGDLIIKMK
ncbi:hypothetical protein ID854_01690 [Xenorhabdus sp. M]|uniref:Uncharacterized protein n=1 Tax=Xenorhabdus szentirmaii TaxID=290112 RepID=A0AAW3YME0_9GAMM|nr:hypothetical protein [Xenorhabdus sp. M]MBD2799205.1 hypothetical protein [Xenorhabdus sp. M]